MINENPHYGFAHVGGKLSLDFKSAFTAWIAKLAGDTGAEVGIFVFDKAWFKTRQQEKGFHAMIQPLSRETGWAMSALKQYFLGEIFGWNEIKGVKVLTEPSTSALNKRQYSELIERAMDIAVTDFDGFQLEAPSEYRERKEKERKASERRERRGAGDHISGRSIRGGDTADSSRRRHRDARQESVQLSAAPEAER